MNPEHRTTSRLRLEPIGSEHVPDLLQLHSDPVVSRWYAGAYSTLDEAEAFALDCRHGWEKFGVGKWMAYDRVGGALVGRGGLSRMDPSTDARTLLIDPLVASSGWSRQRLELGWAVLSPHHGRGYATEIGRKALDFAGQVLKANAVIAFTERANRASWRVMERLGMSFAGQFEADGVVDHEGHLSERAPYVVYAQTLYEVQKRGV